MLIRISTKMLFVSLSILILTVVYSCKIVQSESDVKYSLIDYRYDRLFIKNLKQDKLKVCYTEKLERPLKNITSEEIKEKIRGAILAWIEPLRILTKDKLVSKIEFLSEKDGCVHLSNGNGGRSDITYSIGQRGKVDPNPEKASYFQSGSYLSGGLLVFIQTELKGTKVALPTELIEYHILHETGHVFGLGDTYASIDVDSDIPKDRCAKGQSMSVMCEGYRDKSLGIWFQTTTISKDDIEGVRAKFCREYYPSVYEKECSKLKKAGAQPNLTKNGKSFFTMGVEFSNNVFEKGPDKIPCITVSQVNKSPQSMTYNANEGFLKLKNGMCISHVNGLAISSPKDIEHTIAYSHLGIIRLTIYVPEFQTFETYTFLLDRNGINDENYDLVVGDIALIVGGSTDYMGKITKVINVKGNDSMTSELVLVRYNDISRGVDVNFYVKRQFVRKIVTSY